MKHVKNVLLATKFLKEYYLFLIFLLEKSFQIS